MKRKNIARTLTLIAWSALALGLGPAAKAAERGCSNESMRGTFSYTGTGFITAPPAFAGPFVEVGTQTFNGFGGTTATATLSQNGNIIQITVTGSYSVNPDCTGTLTLQVAPLGITVHVFLVIDEGSGGFQGIETDSGLTITRLAHRQFPVGDRK